jgi:hypothetical protein
VSGRGTLILAVALAVLCVGYWFTVSTKEAAEEAAQEARRLFSFSADDVKSIRFEQFGKDAVTGVREAAGVNTWTLLEPDPEIAANAELWPLLAEHLAALNTERALDPDQADAALYGLEKAPLVVTAETFSGESVTLRFGTMEPTQTRRYAVLNDSAYHLIDKDEYFWLDRDLDILRDKRILHVSDAGVSKITYTRLRPRKRFAEGEAPEGVVEGHQESISVVLELEDGRWYLREPVQTLADWDAVDKLVRDLQFMAPGREFVDKPEHLSDYGLEPAYERIVFTAGDEEHTLYLGDFKEIKESETGGGIFIKSAALNTICVIDPYLLDSLPKTPTAFEERRLITRKPDGVQKVVYQPQGETIVMEKVEGKGWTITDPVLDRANQVSISGWLANIFELTAMGVMGPPQRSYGFDAPRGQVHLHFEGSDTPLTIAVGNEIAESGNYYALQDTGVTLSLAQASANVLTKPLFFFQDNRLLNFEPAAAREIDLRSGDTRYMFERLESRWYVTEPAGHVWESQSDATALLEALSTAYARHQVAAQAPEDLSPYGLDTPNIEITVSIQPGDDVQERMKLPPLQIGEPDPSDSRMRFGVAAGRKDLVHVPQTVVDNIREALRGVIAK